MSTLSGFCVIIGAMENRSEIPNIVIILSDEHMRDAAGCYGSEIVRTPNLDRLASGGTVFERAYTTCPICIPARASLATGRYVHETGCWDNGLAYHGEPPSWGHALLREGYTVDSIGKLHYRSAEDPVGFGEMIEPLNVVDGVGDVLSCIRDDPPFRKKRLGIEEAGPGNSTYLTYDAQNATAAVDWIRTHAHDPKPWVLFVGFVLPHPPYTAPPELYDSYPLEDLDLPPQWSREDRPDHPVVDYFRKFFDFDTPFSERRIRELTAAYYGCCTYLDTRIGEVLDAVEQTGIADKTRIIYTSDHGEDLGARGLFGKFTMYEESAAIPLILAGPGVPQGRRIGTPASLVDIYPTILGSFGISDRSAPGISLIDLAAGTEQDRTVFAEYHAVGSRHGFYMVRDRRYKYVYYVDAPAQLFDLETDPHELDDLAEHPEYESLVSRYRSELLKIVDPEAADAAARAAQRAMVERFGGREAVIRRGAFDNSPVPGEKPKFH